MKRLVITAAAVLALGLAAGCSDDKKPSGQPKAANPDDPNLKKLTPTKPSLGGGGKPTTGPKVD